MIRKDMKKKLEDMFTYEELRENKNEKQKWLNIRKVNKVNSSKIFSNFDGVVSTSVGYKVTGGVTTDYPCVRVGVLEKGPVSVDQTIPKYLNGVKTDVVEEGVDDPFSNRYRPVPGGVNIGSPKVSNQYGTIGCCVFKLGLSGGITCGHVIPYSDGVRVTYDGPPYFGANGVEPCVVNNTVLQPAPPYGGVDSTDTIGFTFEYSDYVQDQLDAAIFISNKVAPDTIYGITLPNGLAYTSSFYPGNAVIKSGAKTGVTTGTIVSIDAQRLISYKKCDGTKTTLAYQNCIILSTGFAAGGDSGSIVMRNTSTKPVIGLIFGGTTKTASAHDFGDIMAKFKITL